MGGYKIWERKMMWLTDYPYHACKSVTWAKVMYIGDRKETDNPFECSIVVINLTGTFFCLCGN